MKKNIENKKLKSIELHPNLLNFIKTRGWYKENLSISKCITQNLKGGREDENQIRLMTNILNLNKKLLEIYDPIEEYEKINKVNNDIHEKEKDLALFRSLPKDFRKSMNKFLLSLDQDSLIQNHL